MTCRAGGRATSVARLLLAFAATSCARGDGRAGTPPPEPNPHATDSIGTVREIYDGTLSPELAVRTFRNIDRLFAVRRVPRSRTPLPLPPSRTPMPDVRIPHRGAELTLEQYLDSNRVAALLVLRDSAVVIERYRYGNGPTTRWMSMSVAKSITATLFGAALHDGRLASLDDPVARYVPALAGSAYDGVTVRDVLTMTSGVRWRETYTDPTSDRRALLEAQIAQRPGAAMAVMRALPRAAPPGTVFRYSTGETQVAAEILRGALGGPIAEYLAERIWRRVGMAHDATWWLDAPNGTEIAGSGFSATLRDYGRFGLFILGGGMVGRARVLPDGWVREMGAPQRLRDGTPIDYGYLWWTAETPRARANAAFTAVGIHGQLLHVDPVARIVIVVWGARPHPTLGEVVSDEAFLDAIVEALVGQPSRVASLGSTRAARRAGPQLAASVATTTSSVTPLSTAGSFGATP